MGGSRGDESNSQTHDFNPEAQGLLRSKPCGRFGGVENALMY